MKAEIQTITPELASAYLANAHEMQRSINPKRVRAFVDDMTSGRWVDSPDAIAFGADGKLENGQHRLTAIVQSGMPQRMLVVRGISENAFQVMDAGQLRSARQRLGMSGINTTQADAMVMIAKRIYGFSHLYPTAFLGTVAGRYRHAAEMLPVDAKNKHCTAPLRAVMILAIDHGISPLLLGAIPRVIRTRITECPEEYAIAAWVAFRERDHSHGGTKQLVEWYAAQRLVKAVSTGEVLRVIRHQRTEYFTPANLKGE